MLDFLYRASFLLYEFSFLVFAGLLAYAGWWFYRINRALQQPAYWIWPVAGALFLALCAGIHFYVYHHLSPRYLLTSSPELLMQMYVLKTVSMGAIFLTGAGLSLSGWLYYRRLRR